MKEESLFCDPAVEIHILHTPKCYFIRCNVPSAGSHIMMQIGFGNGGKKNKTGKASSFERRGNKICQSTSSVAAAAAAAAEPYYIYRI